jgi:hypothetical protein
MSDKTERFPPPSKQPVQPAGSHANAGKTLEDANKDDAPSESNGSTGDQVGGQSSHSEKELRGEQSLPAGDGPQGHPEHPRVDPPETEGGEDESSTEKNGDDSHLHENQKSSRLKS